MNSQYKNVGDLTSDAMASRMMDMSLKQQLGIRGCDHIYYSEEIGFKQECDTIASVKFNQSFTSRNLPGSSVLQIPNLSCIDMVGFRVRFNSWPADVALPRGWLYHLIQRVDFRLASSVTLSYSGPQLIASLLQKCETMEKRDQVLKLGGDLQVAANANAIDATAFLNLPVLGKLRNNKKKLPFDSGLLNLPISITVYFNSLQDICGGTGLANVPTFFDEGEFWVRQIDFKDMEHSLKTDLRMNPMASYYHPFVYEQHIPLNYVSNVAADLSSRSQLSLTGFRYGNVTGIQLLCVQNNPASPNAKNVMNYLRMENIQLSFNGIILYDSRRRVHDVVTMSLNNVPNYIPNALITGTASANFVLTPINSYFYTIDLSQYASLFNEGAAVQSGLELGSNVLQLAFNNPELLNQACTLYVSYLYTSAAKVSQGGNQVDFAF